MAGARSIISLTGGVATALLATLLLARCGALTDEAVAPGAVEGLVYNAETLEPVEGVDVSVAGLPARTAADGTFRIDRVPPGSQQMVAQRADYALWADYIDVLPGQTKQAEINLLPIGPIQIRIKRPFSGSLVDAGLTVTAEIRSEFSVTEFTAEVGGISAPFQYVPSDGDYDAVLSLETLDSPSDRILVARARDANGDSTRVAVPIRFDRRPTLTVVTPTGDAVATPSLRVTATCTDDDPSGCAEVIVFSGQTLARAEGGSLDEDVSFAAFSGQTRSVIIGGRDRAGQLDSVVRTVFVETGTSLTPVADGGPGTLVDATADRLLVVNSAGAADTVTIVDRAGQARTVLYVPAAAGERIGASGVGYPSAALTPRGALFAIGPWTGETLYEWRDGARSALAPGFLARSLAVAGDYAIWVVPGDLYRRDVVAGVTTIVGATSVAENGLAENGDVAFANGGAIQRWRGGTITTVGSGYAPVTDGANVVWARGPLSTGPFTIALRDGGGETELSANQYYQPVHAAHYLARNGWVAFTREDLTRVRQVWTRSPAGVLRQVGFFGSHNWIEDIGTDGTVVFFAVDGRRYRAAPGGSTVEIGSRLGRAKFIDGQLHVMIGPTLFRVN